MHGPALLSAGAVTDYLQRLLENSGPWLLPAIGLASLIEYLFPPFPGDVVSVLGTYLALENHVSLFAVFGALATGSVAGPCLAYAVGRWLGPRLSGNAQSPLRRWFSPARVARAEALYRRWGPWFILGNRFVPATRSLVFVFAGFARIPLWLTLALGIPSGLAWNALVILVSYELRENAGAAIKLLSRLSRSAGGIALLLGVIALVVVFVRRHLHRSQ